MIFNLLDKTKARTPCLLCIALSLICFTVYMNTEDEILQGIAFMYGVAILALPVIEFWRFIKPEPNYLNKGS